MGLFKRFKKEDNKENIENLQGIESNIDIKTTNDIQNEQIKNECNNLQNELREKNERLNTILEKIQLSKNNTLIYSCLIYLSLSIVLHPVFIF